MSDDIFHRSLIPLRWLAPLNPLKYDLVIIWDWLNVEVDARVEQELPILKKIVGYRNRDVHNYVNATNNQWSLHYLGIKPWQIVQLEVIRAGIIARDEGQALTRSARRFRRCTVDSITGVGNAAGGLHGLMATGN